MKYFLSILIAICTLLFSHVPAMAQNSGNVFKIHSIQNVNGIIKIKPDVMPILSGCEEVEWIHYNPIVYGNSLGNYAAYLSAKETSSDLAISAAENQRNVWMFMSCEPGSGSEKSVVTGYLLTVHYQ